MPDNVQSLCQPFDIFGISLIHPKVTLLRGSEAHKSLETCSRSHREDSKPDLPGLKPVCPRSSGSQIQDSWVPSTYF